jgi:hypothetical protein
MKRTDEQRAKAREYYHRRKERDPEGLRIQHRNHMRQQRRENGDNLRKYQREYMRKYRKDVQGMIPMGNKRAPRYSKELVIMNIEAYERLIEENLRNVPWKQKSKDVTHKKLMDTRYRYIEYLRLHYGEEYTKR